MSAWKRAQRRLCKQRSDLPRAVFSCSYWIGGVNEIEAHYATSDINEASRPLYEGGSTDRDSYVRGHSCTEVRSGKRGNALEEEASVPSDDISLHLCCESTIRLQMRNLAVSEVWLATTRTDESCPGGYVWPFGSIPLCQLTVLQMHKARQFDRCQKVRELKCEHYIVTASDFFYFSYCHSVVCSGRRIYPSLPS
jgi:hypothetical protein